ncbi:hypothetical protein BGZ95_007603, partial [Linnemannia exigua]
AVIAPFSKEQIENYVEQYVPLEPRTWRTEDYMDRLTTIPNLLDLSNALSNHDRATFDQLLDAGFISMCIEYSMRLASAIFEKQDGGSVIQYVRSSEKGSWKAEFFGDDPVTRLLLESSPLTRSGNYFQFVHRSMLEYFFSCVIYSPPNLDDIFSPQIETPSPIALSLDPDNPLYRRNLVTEPSIILFLCDRVNLDPAFERELRSVVNLSKTDSSKSTAATNAITILVRAGAVFHGADLRGAQVPGADLSEGQFDSAQLQGADLTGAILSMSWLRQANLSGARLEGVRFRELPSLDAPSPVDVCTYSPDGSMLVVGFDSGFNIHNTTTWTLIRRFTIDNGVLDITFSPDSQQVV